MLAIIAGSTGTASDIAWKNADAFHAVELLESPQAVMARHAGQSRHLIARFDAVPTETQRAALKASGVEVLAPLGGSAFFVRVAPDARPADAIRAGGLTAMGEIARTHKLDSKLTAETAPAWAIADEAARDAERAPANPTIGVYVQMHRGVALADESVADLVERHGGVVRDKIESINSLVVELPFLAVAGLADEDRVQWVEPALPRMGTYNASNRIRVQADTAHAAPYNLDGSGVTVFVYDGGTVRATHQDYSGRATLIDGDSQSYHATHVAGTVGGDGSANFTHRGMAPGVSILSAGFEYDGSGTFLYTNPGDIEFDYANALGQGAVISNNSIGSNIAPNGFPCSYEGDYGLTAATIDAIVAGSLGDPIVIFWAAGNERGPGSCGTTYNTSPPPGNNKNAITVGALNSNDDSVTGFTSFGPSDDGRIRPVISAPGCQTGGDGGVTSLDNDSDTDYTSLCGTSMASPTAAGVGALIFEDFRATFPNQGDPSNQLMKVILSHTAVDLFNTGPDNQTGYGSIRAIDAIEFTRAGNWDEDSVFDGGVKTYSLDVAPGESELKITLAWDDAPGTPNVSRALVNDLDLVVIDPSGGRHFPWTIPLGSPGSPAVQTSEDHLNNIEQVQVANPQAGPLVDRDRRDRCPRGPAGLRDRRLARAGRGPPRRRARQRCPGPAAPRDAPRGPRRDHPGHRRPRARQRHHALPTRRGRLPDRRDERRGGRRLPRHRPGRRLRRGGRILRHRRGRAGGRRPRAPGLGRLRGPDRRGRDRPHRQHGDRPGLDGFGRRDRRAVDPRRPRRLLLAGAPGADADGSGQAWVTDNSAAGSCNSDVDNGTTTLTSPVYDLTGGLFEVAYRYWFSDISTGSINGDEWAVDVSLDGGASWARARTVTTASPSWRADIITVGPDGEYPETDAFRLRFSANDVGTQNVIEAGLDDLRVTRLFCEDTACPADLAEPTGVLDLADVQAFINGVVTQDPIADLAAPFGVFDLADVQTFIDSFNAGCP
jgi:subtilisin family serine protease